MGSLLEKRLQEAMAIWRRWYRHSNSTSAWQQRLADENLKKLAEHCSAEISEAVKANGRDVVADHNIVRRVALDGARRAAETLKNGHGRDLLEHVKVCVGEVLQEIIAERKAKLERHTPEELLEFLLLLPRDIAVSQLALLGAEKRLDLLELIAQQLMQRSAKERLEIWFTPEREPEDELRFLAWYLLMLDAAEPSVRDVFAHGQVKTLIMGRGLSLPKNKQGEPVNPIGPILVKVYDVLTGLPNNQIPAPARSDTKLGISFDVDRSVIKRWKDHPEWEDLRVDIKPDGEGGLHYAFNLEALLRSVRIVQGQKRGRPPKDSR